MQLNPTDIINKTKQRGRRYSKKKQNKIKYEGEKDGATAQMQYSVLAIVNHLSHIRTGMRIHTVRDRFMRQC